NPDDVDLSKCNPLFQGFGTPDISISPGPVHRFKRNVEPPYGPDWQTVSNHSNSVTTQQGWLWCRKCQGLHYAGFGAGVCPAGGGHNNASWNYVMFAYNLSSLPASLSSGLQNDW